VWSNPLRFSQFNSVRAPKAYSESEEAGARARRATLPQLPPRVVEAGCKECLEVAQKGRKQRKIVICVAGMSGSGKSTVARMLAEKYGLKYLSGGDALKALAIEAGYKPTERGWWVTEEGLNFHRKRVEDLQFDQKVDKKLIEWAEQGNVVIDSWTMPWLLKKGFKIWLEASLEGRAKRLMKRNNISFKKALNVLKEKDGISKIIYERSYGFSLGEDFSPFNLVVDTNELSADETFRALCLVIERLYFKKT